MRGVFVLFFFSSRRRHTRCGRDWSSDVCSSDLTDGRTNRPLPQLGSVAKQAGTRAGRNIARLVRGEPTQPFTYRDKGTMGAIGRGAAVVEMPFGLTVTGYLAWWLWLGVHLVLLSGGEAKLLTFLDWLWSMRLRQRGMRIVVE